MVKTAGAALIIGVPSDILKRARDKGLGPCSTYVHGSGYSYKEEDILAWLEEHNKDELLPRPRGKELRFDPDRETEEWFDLNTETFLPVKRSTDPRYKKLPGGGYVKREGF